MKIIYGMQATRPELSASIVMQEITWWAHMLNSIGGFAAEVLVPAALYGASAVCFAYAFS